MTVFDELRALDPEQDRFLYHYTTAAKLAQVLDDQSLRLGPYESTNDPRESKKWNPRVVFSEDPQGPQFGDILDRANEALSESDRRLRRGGRLACFALDRHASEGAEFGSLFHRGWARARMWDHYAQAHSGACVVFDRGELIERVEEAVPLNDGDMMTYGRVRYADRSVSFDLSWDEVETKGLDLVLRDMRRKELDLLYLTKNRDWESEQEYRIVVVRPDPGESEGVAQPISVPYGSALRAIVLGERFPDTERSVIRSRPGFGRAELLACLWVSGEPKLFTHEAWDTPMELG